jgi:RNA polymerase sigma-70 factor (ECF subfamily)
VALLSASSQEDNKPTLDSGLVQRLRAGDTGAFAEVYDSHSRVVYRLILRMVRNSALAEDLLQEIFLKLWRSAATLDSRATSLEPWLIAVARNHVLDYLKSGRNRRSMRSSPLDSCELGQHLSLPEHDFVFVERVEHLRGALARLEDHQRRVLELAYFEGLTQTEMAARLKLPLGTVKSHVRLALHKLRKNLEKENPK